MKIQLSEIMNSSVSELSDLDMILAFEIEAVERQLNFPERDDKSWREKAMKARDHMKRTRALVRTRLDKLYYGEDLFCMARFLLRCVKQCQSVSSWNWYIRLNVMRGWYDDTSTMDYRSIRIMSGTEC